MIARDHQDHAEGPSGGNLSTFTRSARPRYCETFHPDGDEQEAPTEY